MIYTTPNMPSQWHPRRIPSISSRLVLVVVLVVLVDTFMSMV
jgi:hypothetical protein